MRATPVCVIAASTCLTLAACASAPPQLSFSKPGGSSGESSSDSAACWNYALNTPEGRKEAETVNGSRVVGGGVFALANMAAEKSANNGDAKKDLGNWAAHNSCMGRKGYTSKMAGW